MSVNRRWAPGPIGCLLARTATTAGAIAFPCGLCSILRLSVALIDVALPFENRRSVPLCHADSFGRPAPAGFYAPWCPGPLAALMRSAVNAQ